MHRLHVFIFKLANRKLKGKISETSTCVSVPVDASQSPPLTKYVRLDSEREVRVVPQDVHGFGVGDVLKILPVYLHYL